MVARALPMAIGSAGSVQISRLEIELGRIPRDVGVVLLTLGAVGLVVPGPVPPGTPFLLVGAVILSPRLIRPIGGRLRRRLPVFYRLIEGQVSRFQADLECRYPGSTGRRGAELGALAGA